MTASTNSAPAGWTTLGSPLVPRHYLPQYSGPALGGPQGASSRRQQSQPKNASRFRTRAQETKISTLGTSCTLGVSGARRHPPKKSPKESRRSPVAPTRASGPPSRRLRSALLVAAASGAFRPRASPLRSARLTVRPSIPSPHNLRPNRSAGIHRSSRSTSTSHRSLRPWRLRSPRSKPCSPWPRQT